MEQQLPHDSCGMFWAIVGIFFLVTFLIYDQSLWNPFVRWDDGLLIYENPAIRAITPTTLWNIFTSYDPELYIPLTFFSYQIDYLLAGTNPIMYHLTNLLLHTINALLVCWLLRQLGIRRTIALFCGLLFAAHPLHTEAVAWSSARKDLLSACFFLLSLNWFLYFKATNTRRWYALSIVAFLLALLSKVVVALLPAVLLLFEYSTQQPLQWKQAGKRMLPYAILSVLFIIIALFGKQHVLASATPWQLLLMAAKSTVFYLQKFFIPTGLSVLYPYTDPITITSPDFFIPVLLCIVLVGMLSVSLIQKKWLGLGLGFFFLMLIPSFTNFSKGGDFYFASDRYAYLASIGILLVIGQFWSSGILEYSNTRILQYSGIPLFAILILFSWLSHAQAATWNGSEALFRHAVALYPNSHVAHTNLGNIEYRNGHYEEALEEYRTALSIRDHHRTRSNMAAVLLKQGKTDEALQEYQRVLSMNPESKEAHFGLGVLYTQQQQYEVAAAEFTKALELDPTYAEVNITFGAMYLQMGNPEAALEQFDQALAIMPFSAQALYNKAIALRALKRTKEAIIAYEQAIAAEPSFVAARINLGILYHERKRPDDAIAQFEAVLKYDPGNARAKAALDQLQQTKK